MDKVKQPIVKQWLLSPQDKHIVKMTLVQYMVDNNFSSADILPNADLAWNLLPIMGEFNTKWNEIETFEEFQAHNCYSEFIKYLKVQFRMDGSSEVMAVRNSSWLADRAYLFLFICLACM